MSLETGLLVNQLAELLGPANVLRTENNIVVKPSSPREIAEVINLAGKEEIVIEPVNYVIGPPVSPGRGGKILLSLERMNKVRHFDRQSLYLMVEPAVAIDEITKIVTAHGLYFPGKECGHTRVTIGESVAACFKEGAPNFTCPFACIGGLEMALLDGGIVTIDGNCVQEVDNYSLSYLLAGYRENVAIITGMRLKIFPERTGEYLLVVAFKQLDDVLEILPSLASYQDSLKKVIALDASVVSPSAAYLKNLFPGTKEHGAYVLFSLEGALSKLEPVVHGIADICHGRNAQEVLVADATYQKEMVCSAFNSLLTELTADNHFREESHFQSINEFYHQGLPYRPKAILWQTGPGIRKAYYTVK